MNDYVLSVRRRRRTLLIVEGDDEKNMLFWALFRAFPEMAIKYDDVWIYGTNIYMLYKDTRASSSACPHTHSHTIMNPEQQLTWMAYWILLCVYGPGCWFWRQGQ